MKPLALTWNLLIIAAVAAVVVTAATAAFTDQAVLGGNTFQAGTLYMSVDGECDDREYGGGGAGGAGVDGNTGCELTGAVTATALKPGDPATEHEFVIVNEGSLAGTLSATPSALVDEDHAACALSFWTVVTGPLSETALAPAAQATYPVSVALNGDAPNACQGATLTLTITFDLVQ